MGWMPIRRFRTGNLLAWSPDLGHSPHHEGARSASPVVLTESIGCGEKRVVRASYLECTRDDLRRQVVYLGEREDKSAVQVRRDSPAAIEIRLHHVQ